MQPRSTNTQTAVARQLRQQRLQQQLQVKPNQQLRQEEEDEEKQQQQRQQQKKQKPKPKLKEKQPLQYIYCPSTSPSTPLTSNTSWYSPSSSSSQEQQHHQQPLQKIITTQEGPPLLPLLQQRQDREQQQQQHHHHQEQQQQQPSLQHNYRIESDSRGLSSAVEISLSPVEYYCSDEESSHSSCSDHSNLSTHHTPSLTGKAVLISPIPPPPPPPPSIHRHQPSILSSPPSPPPPPPSPDDEVDPITPKTAAVHVVDTKRSHADVQTPENSHSSSERTPTQKPSSEKKCKKLSYLIVDEVFLETHLKRLYMEAMLSGKNKKRGGGKPNITHYVKKNFPGLIGTKEKTRRMLLTKHWNESRLGELSRSSLPIYSEAPKRQLERYIKRVMLTDNNNKSGVETGIEDSKATTTIHSKNSIRSTKDIESSLTFAEEMGKAEMLRNDMNRVKTTTAIHHPNRSNSHVGQISTVNTQQSERIQPSFQTLSYEKKNRERRRLKRYIEHMMTNETETIETETKQYIEHNIMVTSKKETTETENGRVVGVGVGVGATTFYCIKDHREEATSRTATSHGNSILSFAERMGKVGQSHRNRFKNRNIHK